MDSLPRWREQRNTAINAPRGTSRELTDEHIGLDKLPIGRGAEHMLSDIQGTWSAEFQTLEGHGRPVKSVIFSPDGRLLASGSYDQTVRIWDTATGALQQILEGHSHAVLSVAFSPDGQLLASGSYDQTVRLWDTATGALQQTLEGHSHAVLSVAFSPDGRLLASGSYDQTVRIWDTATGALQQTLKGHSHAVLSVTFSPDGRLLASSSYDRTVRLWDTATGALRQTLEDYSGPKYTGHTVAERSSRVQDGRVEFQLREYDPYGPPVHVPARGGHLYHPSDPLVAHDRPRREDSPSSRPPRLVRRQSSIDTFDRLSPRRMEPYGYRDGSRRRPSPGRYHEREVYEDIRITEPDYYGDEEYHKIRERDRMDYRRHSSSGVRFREQHREEKPYPRKGRTRVPLKLVNVQAVLEAGYPYYVVDDAIVIQKALSKEQIDEVIRLSRDTKRRREAEYIELPAYSPPRLRERATREHLYVDASPSFSEAFSVETSPSCSRNYIYEEIIERPRVRDNSHPRFSVHGRRRLSASVHHAEAPANTGQHNESDRVVRPHNSENDFNQAIRALEEETRLLRLEREGSIELTRQRETDTFVNRGNEGEISEIRKQDRKQPNSRILRAMMADSRSVPTDQESTEFSGDSTRTDRRMQTRFRGSPISQDRTGSSGATLKPTSDPRTVGALVEGLEKVPWQGSFLNELRFHDGANDFQADMHNTQSEDRFSIRHSGEASASSLTTDATTPEHQKEDSIDAGITQPNDLNVVLNAIDHYKKLDDLECETARLCGIDRGLDVQNRHSSLVECCHSISNYLTALCNLRNEGFCRDTLVILVKDRSRPDVAKAIHVPLSTISNLEESLKGKDSSSLLPSCTFFPLISELHGDSVPSSAVTGDYVPFLDFLCAVFAIGLVSFSGSHVCRFDIGITGQSVEEIPVGLGDSFRTRNLACLSSFIGGPAWVLGKSEPLAQQEGLKISLTVQDLDELWGPVWLLGGSADEGRIIRTERGYIVPLPRQEQGADTEEIECHWRKEYSECLMSQIDSDDRPMLRPTSRILVGTDTATEAGLTVNETCRFNTSLKEQCMASRLQLTGTTRSQLVDDGYEVNLMGGQYVSGGIVKKWKRMPARTQKSVLIELCQKPNTKLSPLLKARVGLEVSACTGNAQRVTLWNALRLSQAKPAATGNMASPEYYCEHTIGDINCIHSCWSRPSSVEEIDNISEWHKLLTLSDARRLVIQSILALEHTGIDGEGNLQAWWPFSESPLTSRISRSTSKETHDWFRMIKDGRDVSSFAVLSQRCLEFGERRCVQKLSGASRNGSCKVYQTGLYTRILPVKGTLASLVQGAKLLVGNANLTVEQASQTERESVIIATVSANPFRVLEGFLGEGKVLCVQEHVHHDIPTSLSIPMFVY